MRLGVLTNPVALHNRRFPFTHLRILDGLASEADAVVTADQTEIPAAVHHLLNERGTSVLAINGGDGTIHAVLNAITAACGKEALAGRVRLPMLLLLNGGTYNMAARAMQTGGDPVSTVHRFLARYRERPLSSVVARRVGLLEVRGEGRAPMLGMFFGSQVVCSALELCDRMGSGYVGLAKLLGRGVVSYATGGAFLRENLWRLTPEDPTVRVDGRTMKQVSAVVAATVDMKLAKGMVWALTTAGSPRGFHVKVIHAKAPTDIVRLLPSLLWEVRHPMIRAFPEATSVRVSGSFTLDGELYDHRGALDITLSPYRFDVVAGGEL